MEEDPWERLPDPFRSSADQRKSDFGLFRREIAVYIGIKEGRDGIESKVR